MAKSIDSKKEKLSLTDLLSIVNSAADTGVDLRTFTLQTVAMCSRPDTYNMTFGNTLFIIIDCGDRMANFIVYNADTAENLAENYQRAVNATYMLGFDEAFVQFDPRLLEFYKGLLENLDVEDSGYQIAQLDNGNMQAQMRLGPSREGVQ
jgi:hypothetical protein